MSSFFRTLDPAVLLVEGSEAPRIFPAESTKFLTNQILCKLAMISHVDRASAGMTVSSRIRKAQAMTPRPECVR